VKGWSPAESASCRFPNRRPGHRNAYEIVRASERIEDMLSATNTNGDPARSISYQWTQ
jgi:hypothetical protein